MPTSRSKERNGCRPIELNLSSGCCAAAPWQIQTSLHYSYAIACQVKLEVLDSSQMHADALTSLRQHFGFTDFREGQAEVIRAILEGRDAVVVMPTGSGKSLCYQLPAMMLGGATVVVSPLIALMKDQVDALRERGLPATFINSSIDPDEQRARIDALRRGQFKLVYVAPERFRSFRFVEALKSVRIALFAVDEAHCVSTWGHDFRPDYLQLKNVIQTLGGPQALALTATATPYVRSDIIQELGLRKPQTFVSGFDRPNLRIDVVHIQNERQKIGRIAAWATTHEGSGVIYASTRKAVEQVAEELRWEGLHVTAYHAGMKDSVRIKAQEDFMAGRAQLIVATNAFGMGIDKPDIRFVAHYQMPGSIEAYYQEIGRAGRDGSPSLCLLLFNYADKNTHEFFIEGSYPDADIVQAVYDALWSTGLKRIELSASELGRRAGIRNDMAVQSAIYLLERAGHIERTHSPSYRPSERSSGSAKQRFRSILMLDSAPAPKLGVNFSEVGRRAALERRKLREMIEFCYTEYCYRGHILDYFGDRRPWRQCDSCGKCAPSGSARKSAVHGSISSGRSRSVTPVAPRSLTEDEALRVRKILACSARMKGRFGKQLLAATLRGSAAKNVMQAHLNELSTYGLLKEMRQEDLLAYIEALVTAGCLRVSAGEYPTVSLTEMGERVMREQEQVQLALSENGTKNEVGQEFILAKTASQTYALFCRGLSVTEIAQERNLVTSTIEGHLLDCIRAQLPVDTSRLVASEHRKQIEQAIAEHGTEKLRPLRDSLPETISYNMIRFVVAEHTK
jgi:ATP-dependent DNA helicase RecQ